MKNVRFTLRAIALIFVSLAPVVAQAQEASAATGTSQPQPVAPHDPIPPSRDVPYPGTIQLAVDATDIAHGIFRINETVPVKPGPLVLLYPQWLPGAHAPQGAIDKLAGLLITANGKAIAWRRDPVDIYAFHLDIPAGVTAINVGFQFLSATDPDQGPVVMTPNILALEWISTVLYPAGNFVRQVTVEPSVTVPRGWTAASALRQSGIIPILYTIGILSCVFHLANGIWTFGITWGIWVTPAAQKWAQRSA